MNGVRGKNPTLIKLNALDDGLNTAPDPAGSDGPRRTSSAPIHSDEVVPSTTRRLSSRLSSLVAERLNRVRKIPLRGSFAKMDSIESLDLASPAAPIRPNLEADSSQSRLEQDETLDGYFESMKKRNSMKKLDWQSCPDRLDHDLELSFNTSASRGSATFVRAMHRSLGSRSLGARSLASGSLIVRTEPALRQSKSKKKKRSKSSKSRNSSSKGRGLYAQICFEEGRADVKYACLPCTNQEKTDLKEEKTDLKEASQAQMPQAELVINSLSSTAA